jgi:ubiquitin C-terminal hydrolase
VQLWCMLYDTIYNAKTSLNPQSPAFSILSRPQFYSGDTRPFSPHQLLHSVWTHAHQLAGYDQQDAHEFFIEFINGMHEHCQGKPLANPPPPNPPPRRPN